MKESKDGLKVKIKIDLELSFWSAIKIRIAGKNFTQYVEKLIKESQKHNEQNLPS